MQVEAVRVLEASTERPLESGGGKRVLGIFREEGHTGLCLCAEHSRQFVNHKFSR